MCIFRKIEETISISSQEQSFAMSFFAILYIKTSQIINFAFKKTLMRLSLRLNGFVRSHLIGAVTVLRPHIQAALFRLQCCHVFKAC